MKMLWSEYISERMAELVMRDVDDLAHQIINLELYLDRLGKFDEYYDEVSESV